jgi:hypothetical protein
MNDVKISKLDHFIQKISDHDLVLKFKSKWGELDSQKQVGLQIVFVILFLSFFISFTIYGAYKLQSSQSIFVEKTNLLNFLKESQANVQAYNQYTRGIQSEDNPPQWDQLISSAFLSHGVSQDSIEIKRQKNNKFGDHLMETLFAIQIKNIKLKPLIYGIHSLESQLKPLKVRKIEINSKGEKEPVNALIYISGFTLVSSVQSS